MKLTWIDFERMQKAMIDNPLEDAEEIFAWLRTSIATYSLFPIVFLRLWESSIRIPRLKVRLAAGLFSAVRLLLDLFMTLGGEYLDQLIKLIKSLFGLIERSEDV
jgi:hypothetical protein